MLGVPNGKVVLVPWTEQWEQHFTMEMELLKLQLGPLLAAVHHIGSTAVPHLNAKPIIDIALEIRYQAEIRSRGRRLRSEWSKPVDHQYAPVAMKQRTPSRSGPAFFCYALGGAVK